MSRPLSPLLHALAASTTCAVLAFAALSPAPAHAAAATDDSLLERLAACQESWMDWKQDPAAVQRFRDLMQSRFTPEPRSPAWTPKQPTTAFGLPVTKAYPQSVGMGVGFSLEVRAAPAQVRQAMETAIGRPMSCETGEGELACEVELGKRRTAMILTANEGRGTQSLIGCFYYYQQ